MKRFSPINLLVIFLVITLLLFYPAFSTYFHQDDFIHFSVSETMTKVFEAFNLFKKGDFPFYRPLPTQVYFFLGKTIFGLNPLGYHLVNYLIYIINAFFVFKIIYILSKNKIISIISSVIFAINSTHVAPLYSPAYIHELLYVFFGLLTSIFFIGYIRAKKFKNYFISVLFFILALMTKETAVILPLILLLLSVFHNKDKLSLSKIMPFLPFFLIVVIYLYGHFIYYGIARSPSYQLIIGLKSVNILIWYLLWGLSTPNILIDFIGPGLKFNPVFLQVSSIQGYIYLILFPLLLFFIFLLLILLIKKSFSHHNWHLLKAPFFGLIWFVIGMLPLIIFPLHKLATEQAFSLIGLAFALSSLIASGIQTVKLKAYSYIIMILYLIIASNSILLARKTHWIVRSAAQAENTINFLKIHYPNLNSDNILYFKNGLVKIPQYGSSRQIYQALGNGVAIKLIFNKDIKIFIEDRQDLPIDLKNNPNVITINSSDLLGY